MKLIALSSITFLMASSAFAQSIVPCGGSFNGFMQKFGQAAISKGVPSDAVNAVIANAKHRNDVLKLDRSQASFKQTFLEFSSRTVSSNRLQIGAQKLQQYGDVFATAQNNYGVSPEVIATFWAMETDFGANQGNMSTVSALATLAHDCRRPELFQPQLLGAMQLTAKGGMDPATTTGAWAGEIGMVQMLPADILKLGVDGDGDGRVDLKKSPNDAILSAARMLASHGWRKNEPWIQEVIVNNDEAWQYSGLDQKIKVSDWKNVGVSARNGSLPNAGMPASLVAPQGRFGPVFLTYPNYDVFLEWNQSFIYSLSAAYMATRMAGEPKLLSGNPEKALTTNQVKTLQTRLAQKGYNVGKVDGIIGAKTRAAIRDVQIKNGVISHGWPTAKLMSLL